MLSFFDFDEFLELKKNIKFGNYLDNWLFYSDNDLFLYDSRPVNKRFTLASYDNGGNILIKSTIRRNLKCNYCNNVINLHTSLIILHHEFLLEI